MTNQNTGLKGAAKQYQNPTSQEAIDNPKDNFTFDVGETRLGFVADALSALGQGSPREVKALADYEGKSPDNMLGHYLVTLQDDSQVVLQVKGVIDAPTYERANEFYGHLKEHGVRGPSLIGVGSIDVQEGEGLAHYDLAVTTYREGSAYLDVRSGDTLYKLGQVVGMLQKGLQDIPDELRARALEAAQDTNAVLKKGAVFANSTNIDGLIGETGVSVLKGITDDIAAGKLELCHGDILPGNVMVDSDSRLALLDFDNLGAAMRPASYDVGLAFSRFILSHEEYEGDDAGKLDAASVLLEGYNGVVNPEQRLTFEQLIDAAAIGLACKVINNMGSAEDPLNHGGVQFHSRNFENFMGFRAYALSHVPKTKIEFPNDWYEL